MFNKKSLFFLVKMPCFSQKKSCFCRKKVTLQPLLFSTRVSHSLLHLVASALKTSVEILLLSQKLFVNFTELN